MCAVSAKCIGAIGWILCLAEGLAAPSVEISRHRDCNLFDEKEPVKFEAVLKGFPQGEAKAESVLTDYYGESKTVATRLTVGAGNATPVALDFGVLAPGYYELKVRVAGTSPAAAEAKMMSFGVSRLVQRTAEEARNAGSRFGLKIFQIGSPGIWWRRPEVWNLSEVVDACAKLGLQWTRHQFNQEPNAEPGVIGTVDLVTKHAMNSVMKIEGFPENCYDAARYGTLEEWKAKHPKKAWNRCTVPLKEPYQAWLAAEIGKLPKDQNVFEVGNEVWNYMSGPEFAEWCNMVVETVKKIRPGATIGADPGDCKEFGRKFLECGGMDRMNAWFSHPYSFTPLPENRIRSLVRNVRDILKNRTGRPFDLYVSEYGWSTAPNDKRKHAVSEKVQAQRTTRVSLMLYAEDAKVLIPHWMGDREQDPTEREHWFGFFRLNQQPRPVVIAHAVCARMIDSSRFIGDLWYGPGVGAMLFERKGEYTMALWTAEQDREVQVATGVPQVTAVNMMGAEQSLRTVNGAAKVKLNGDVLYLRGVSPALAAQALAPDRNLNPDQWSMHLDSCTARKMAMPPAIDGRLEDWSGRPAVELKSAGASHETARAMVSWDQNFIYLAVTVSGQSKDAAFQWALRVRPDRETEMANLYDYIVTIRPPGQSGPPVQVSNICYDKPLTSPGGMDAAGIRCATRDTEDGWAGELAIPVEMLKGMPRPASGMKLSGRFALLDGSGKVRLSYGAGLARLWPYISLE